MRALTVAALVFCTSCASSSWVRFDVDSAPRGAKIDVNGVTLGTTPCWIKLQHSSRWVGLMNAPGGWAQGGETYTVTAYPPTSATETLYSQSKVIQPAMVPQGGRLFFDLRLRNVAPRLDVHIKKHPE